VALFLIRTYSTAAFAAHLPPCQPEDPRLGTASDCLCLAFAKIAHILNMMHLEFLKTLSYSVICIPHFPASQIPTGLDSFNDSSLFSLSKV